MARLTRELGAEAARALCIDNPLCVLHGKQIASHFPSQPMPKISLQKASEWHAPESHWDWFFLLALASLLAVLPWSLGVVEAWSELLVIGLAAVLSIGLLLRLQLDPTFSLPRSRTYWPLLAVLALIVFQLLPLSTHLVKTLAPKAIELRTELLGDLAPMTEGTTTLSLYTYETAHDLRMALVFAAIFVVSASVFRSVVQIKQALLMLFILGCVEAGISLLQILTLTKKIHWMYAGDSWIVTSGSFLNYSNFCQFINLTLGAGIALLLVQMKADSRRGRKSARPLTELSSSRYLRPLAGIVLCAVTICTSQSRNGIISLIIASGLIGMLLYRRGVFSKRGWLISMAPWTLVVVLFLTCFDSVYQRMATLETNDSLNNRWELSLGVMRVWQDFPLWGTGLGTHEYIFPLYDSSVTTLLAEHADNDWAQLLEEFGLVGAVAVLIFVLSIFGLAGKLMFSGRSSLSTAAFGLSFGLLATAWHSLSDFGQHLPGVFCLTAMISGLLVAISRYDSNKASKAVANALPAATSSLPLVIGRAVASIAVLGACWWAISGATSAYQGEAWSNVAFQLEQRLQANQVPVSDQSYDDLLTVTQFAADAEPNNVRHQYRLNFYRWQSMSRERDPETNQILLDPSAIPWVTRIAEEVSALRVHCPIFGPAYALEGELRYSVLGDPTGAQLINHAASLAPYDANINFTAGKLAAHEGRIEDAIHCLNRAASLEPKLFNLVAEVYLVDLDQFDLAEKLAGNNYRSLSQLAQLLEDSKSPQLSDSNRVQELRDRSEDLLRDLVENNKATAYEMAQLANVELRKNRTQEAINLYRRALGKKYDQTGWRLALAKSLLAEGRSKQAFHEAKILLRLRPEHKATLQLIEQMGALPVDSDE